MPKVIVEAMFIMFAVTVVSDEAAIKIIQKVYC